jgi:hypothetical protein
LHSLETLVHSYGPPTPPTHPTLGGPRCRCTAWPSAPSCPRTGSWSSGTRASTSQVGGGGWQGQARLLRWQGAKRGSGWRGAGEARAVGGWRYSGNVGLGTGTREQGAQEDRDGGVRFCCFKPAPG